MIKINFLENINPILLAFLATLFTFSLTSLGASLVFFFKNINKKLLSFMMALSSGIMLASAFFSLINPSIEIAKELNQSLFIPVLGFIAGGILLVISELILNFSKKDSSKLLLISSVTLHNIPEGLVVGVAFGSILLKIPGVTIISSVMLALGIGIQNFPEGVCVSFPLRANGISRFKSFIVGSLSGIVEPIFGTLGAIFALKSKLLLPFLLSFSAGAMIIVCALELIPEAFSKNRIISSIGIITGFSIMMCLDIMM